MVSTALRGAASRVLTLALLAGALALPAAAQTISFSPLAGANGDPYLGHVENGFTVTPIAGDWREAHAFGNPTPSIFGGPIGAPLPGTISVARTGGGTFTFQSVDLASNTAPGTEYRFTGFLGLTGVFASVGPISSVDTFETILSVFPALDIDLLLIALEPGVGTTSFNIDNINLTAGPAVIPEPATVALFATGAVLIAGVARRRSRR